MGKYHGCDGPTCASGGMDMDPREFLISYFMIEIIRAMTKDQAAIVDSIIEEERIEPYTVHLKKVDALAIEEANAVAAKNGWAIIFQLQNAQLNMAMDAERKKVQQTLFKETNTNAPRKPR